MQIKKNSINYVIGYFESTPVSDGGESSSGDSKPSTPEDSEEPSESKPMFDMLSYPGEVHADNVDGWQRFTDFADKEMVAVNPEYALLEPGGKLVQRLRFRTDGQVDGFVFSVFGPNDWTLHEVNANVKHVKDNEYEASMEYMSDELHVYRKLSINHVDLRDATYIEYRYPCVEVFKADGTKLISESSEVMRTMQAWENSELSVNVDGWAHLINWAHAEILPAPGEETFTDLKANQTIETQIKLRTNGELTKVDFSFYDELTQEHHPVSGIFESTENTGEYIVKASYQTDSDIKVRDLDIWVIEGNNMDYIQLNYPKIDVKDI